MLHLEYGCNLHLNHILDWQYIIVRGDSGAKASSLKSSVTQILVAKQEVENPICIISEYTVGLGVK